MKSENKGARSYKGEVIGDSMSITINFKWLIQLILATAMLVYSFWKISNDFYGSPEHWYIIARFNNTPTEAHVKIGDTIKIPISLAQALQVVV